MLIVDVNERTLEDVVIDTRLNNDLLIHVDGMRQIFILFSNVTVDGEEIDDNTDLSAFSDDLYLSEEVGAGIKPPGIRYSIPAFAKVTLVIKFHDRNSWDNYFIPKVKEVLIKYKNFTVHADDLKDLEEYEIIDKIKFNGI